MRARKLIIALAPLLLLGIAYPAIQSGKRAFDYEKLRPHPKEIHDRLAGYETSLAEAIVIAEKAAGGGRAASAFMAQGKQAIYTIKVFTEREAQTLVIDAIEGTVRSQTVLPRFPGEPADGQWTEMESGLKYLDIRLGHGEQPDGPTAKVRIHYTGYLVNGVKFDSSRDRGRATTLSLDKGVIPGLREGVLGMRVGGKRKLLVPSLLGYGERGSPPLVPGTATLIFDVELIDVVAQGEKKEGEEKEGEKKDQKE
jgi:peptidylprolyl isomerase